MKGRADGDIKGIHHATWYVNELAKCAADFWYWYITYVHIIDPGAGRGVIRAEAWKHHKELYRLQLTYKHLVILKARQIGVSWLFCALALWEVLFHQGRNVAIFSKDQPASTDMKERAKFIHSKLPDWMALPYGKDNFQILEFPSNNSKIQCFPATESAGRSFSGATLLIIDEWAFHEYARKNWAAIYPIAEKGRVVGITTAENKDTLFNGIWKGAKRGENTFVPIFINWRARPDRTEEDMRRAKANMELLDFYREYPESEADAFLQASECFFPIDILHAQPKQPPTASIESSRNARVFIPPTGSAHDFVAGVDTALGMSKNKGDFSVLQILHRESGQQACVLRSRIPLEDWADEAFDVLNAYGQPYVVIEEQQQGLLVAKIFKDRGYKRLHSRGSGRTYNPTFHTTPGTRMSILNDTKMDLHIAGGDENWKESLDPERKFDPGYDQSGLILYDSTTIDECLAFAWNDDKKKFEASTGHDDTVMALALANMLRKDKAYRVNSEGDGKPYVTGMWKTGKNKHNTLLAVDWSTWGVKEPEDNNEQNSND